MTGYKYITADAVHLARKLHVSPPSTIVGALDLLADAFEIIDRVEPYQREHPLRAARIIAETLNRAEPGAYEQILDKIDDMLVLAERSRRSFEASERLFGVN